MPTRLGRLIVRFLQIESSSGIVLLAFTGVALALANSPLRQAYHAFWETKIGALSLLHWINDGLMTLFFFVVGLEIKREMVTGELADPRKAMLPVVAALGGMVVPAGVYLLCIRGGEGVRGWGVPMATDIAFVVGVLTLFGSRVPGGLKILLLTLAIADDIGAVLVIAVAYSEQLALPALGLAAVGLGGIALLLWLGVRAVLVYALLGVGIWLGFLKSGVHPTVAGVLLGLMTPARPASTAETASPLDRLERALHPWVAFVIMPVFALANAGVMVEPAALGTPISIAVAVGLLLGKPIGIVLFSWVSVRMNMTRLPDGVTWQVMIGAGCLGGIGFTMSLFIAGLAFDGPLRDEAKIGILIGSTLSGALGSLLLLATLQRREKHGEPTQ